MRTREYTNRILEAMGEGVLDPKVVAEMALQWLSEDDVKGMCLANDICCDEDELEDEVDCDDSDDGYALASAGFGTDEDY